MNDACIHDLFKAQAAKTPEAPAIVSGHGQTSYLELNQSSERLAAYLRRNGVYPDDRVGVFMETCSEYILACIGALKAGAAFMPMALESPDNLLGSILAEAKPKVVITKQQHLTRFNQDTAIPILPIDHNQSWRSFEPDCHELHITRDNLAFVPYTSGTTGDPKGVLHTHGSVLSSYFARYKFSSYHAGNRVACNVFFSWEFLRPLLKGGAVYVVPDEVMFLPRALTAYIAEHRVSEILFTPSLLQAILSSAESGVLRARLASLQVVWLNGEVVPTSLVEQALNILPDSTRLFNTYSISETHDVSTVDLKDVALDGRDVCPVGPPMDGVAAQALSEDESSFASVGVGELYISGSGLARGYLQRPDLDRQRFVHIDGALYYSTGDLAEIDSQQMITIIGRNDSMVKIRGYSVYLGAIEEMLRKHCGVLDTVVSVQIEDQADKHLLAYVVREPGTTWRVDAKSGTSRDLRNLLERHLPHYMVPSRFLELDALPINKQTGKLDRKALPAPRRARPVTTGRVQITELASPAERLSALRELWSETLDIDKDSLDDDWDFFDLGGNSLTGLSLTLGIEQAFGIELHGTEIYENPTINELATYLADRGPHMASTVSLAEDAHLDAEIAPPDRLGRTRLAEASSVFVTGATGFLGTFLLDELLRSTDHNTKFYCLARGRESEKDRRSNRILETLKFYGLPGQTLQDRIIPVTGDLTQPEFGLESDRYLQLCDEIDLIFHCAGSVNYVYPYQAIKAHTVDGTLEVIKFACSVKTKAIQYISSNGIFPGGDETPYLENSHIDEFVDRMEGGYNQAKWVAERLIWSAMSRGLPACIIRPGNIGHHSGTGVVNPNDFQTLIIKACLRSGYAPLTPNWRFEMTPVDFLVTAIAKISNDPDHLGKVYNVVQQDPVLADQVFNYLMSNGYVTNLVSLTEWKSIIEETADRNSDIELKVLVQSLDSVEGYLTDTSIYDISRFSETLMELELSPPIVDVDYVTKFLRTS